jgi:hypothetical protein
VFSNLLSFHPALVQIWFIYYHVLTRWRHFLVNKTKIQFVHDRKRITSPLKQSVNTVQRKKITACYENHA